MANVKFSTGPKSAIDEQIATGTIDSGDIVLTSDTDELVFINTKSEKKIIKSKSQNDYTLNGTSLGKYKDGSTIKAGLSIDDLLELLTNKPIPVEYTAPLLNLSYEGIEPGIFEVGTPIALVLNSSFMQNDAGELNSHNIIKNGIVVHEGGAVNSLDIIVNAFTLGDEEVSFSSEATFKAGEVKENNLGILDSENSIKAGTVKSEKLSFTGKRAIFYGASAENMELNSENIRELENTSLELEKGKEFLISVKVGQKEAIFAYPSSFGDIDKIIYMEMNDGEMLSSFTKELVLVNGANDYTPVEYNVYKYSMLTPAVAPMTFKVIV